MFTSVTSNGSDFNVSRIDCLIRRAVGIALPNTNWQDVLTKVIKYDYKIIYNINLF